MKGDGQGRVNYEVTWEAVHRGHCVTLLASQIAPELEQHPQVSWVPISVKQVPTQLLQDVAFSIQSGNWLRQHRSQFALVKVNGCITQSPADVNAVHFVHSTWLQSPMHSWRSRRDLYGAYQWFYTALNASWERQAFRKATMVVAVSEQVKQELLAIGINSKSIRVILNGIDLQEFHPGEGNRSAFGLPEQVPLALFVGDIRTPRKNLETVLHTLVQVPTLHLAIVGSTEGSPYLELATTLKLDRRVHFMGQRQDVPDIMRSVDVFVFPSRYETFGLVVLEAMASGLPVITASTTGAAQLVTVDCGTVLADPEDTAALINSLKPLVVDRTRRQQMGASARTIAEGHSWSSTAQQYVDLFEELVQC
jgi:glycosyltransferase involved in cell wall biosynthesis